MSQTLAEQRRRKNLSGAESVDATFEMISELCCRNYGLKLYLKMNQRSNASMAPCVLYSRAFFFIYMNVTCCLAHNGEGERQGRVR